MASLVDQILLGDPCIQILWFPLHVVFTTPPIPTVVVSVSAIDARNELDWGDKCYDTTAFGDGFGDACEVYWIQPLGSVRIGSLGMASIGIFATSSKPASSTVWEVMTRSSLAMTTEQGPPWGVNTTQNTRITHL